MVKALRIGKEKHLNNHAKGLFSRSNRKPQNARIVVSSGAIRDDSTNTGHLDEDKIGIFMVNGRFSIESISAQSEKDFYENYYLEDDETDCSAENDNNAQTHSGSRTMSNGLKTGCSELCSEDPGDKKHELNNTEDSVFNSDMIPIAKGVRSKKNQRLTRRMVRHIDEERAHIGLSALVNAMLELEEEMSATTSRIKRQNVPNNAVQTEADIKEACLAENLNRNDSHGKKIASKAQTPKHKKVKVLGEMNKKSKGERGENLDFFKSSVKQAASKSNSNLTSKGIIETFNANSIVGTTTNQIAKDPFGTNGDKRRYIVASMSAYNWNRSTLDFSEAADRSIAAKTLIKVTNIVVNGEALEFPCCQKRPSFPAPNDGDFETKTASQSQNTIYRSVNGSLDFLDDLHCRQFSVEDGRLKPWELTWQAMNQDMNSDIPSIMPAELPSRSRYHGTVYARRCRKLLHAISGSARCFACHEFFYSDIDRGWYNLSDYACNLAKIGVNPRMKLSKSEWSYIRRSLRGCRRRFSKSFIASELAKLHNYRNLARDAQRGKNVIPSEFMYEISPLISVGSTVSAYHKKSRIIQRGVVLLQDKVKHGYVVMFDRKEFGWEFCPDTDVARHGPPNLIVNPANFSTDGSSIRDLNNPHLSVGSLPYGTVRNLDVFFKKNNIDWNSRLASNSWTNRSPEHAQLIEGVAERESLVKSMSIIDALLERKTTLLGAFDIMHSFMPSDKESADNESHRPSDNEFQRHYAWLCVNLDETNQRITAALVYLQLLYGKAYSASGSIDGLVHIDKRQQCHQQTESCEYSCKWAKRAKMVTLAVALDIARHFNEYYAEEVSVIKELITQAAGLLLSTAVCIDHVRGEGTALRVWSDGKSSGEDSMPVSATVVKSQIAPVQEHEIKRVLDDALQALSPDMNVAREESIAFLCTAAFRELQQAVELLQSELCLAHA